ncbi:MAG: hypothetical protein AAGA54_24735 [Myxococcota bacterium]
MQALLVAAVVAAVGWIGWLWLSRARKVALAMAPAEKALAAEKGRRGRTPATAVAVDSAAVIEPQVEREPCPWCGGALHVHEHETESHGERRLRRVDGRCGSCSRITTTWFHVRRPSLPN